MSESLLRRLAAGRPLFSGWVGVPEPLIAEAVAQAGFDAVTLDMQHGMVDVASAFRQIAVVRAAGSRAVVRIPVGEYQTASRMIDAGADGIIAPMIETVEDAKAFADFMKYPPLGQRSWGATRALQLDAMDGNPSSDHDHWRQEANRSALAIVMIETRKALESLDDILALPGIDGIFVGPSDLSIALSDGRAVNVDAPEAVKAIEHAAARAQAAGKFAAIFSMSGDHGRRYAALGYRFITLTTEMHYLAAGAKAVLADARG